MKNLALSAVFVLLGLSNARAHVELGTYTGTTPAGEPCQFEVIRQYFETGTPHPLNERIEIVSGATRFTVQHPAVVDINEPRASFNHDAFQGVIAIPGGATALVIDMNHEPGHEGPTGFHLVTHLWRSDVRTGVHCASLVFTPAVPTQSAAKSSGKMIF